ncbi:MAG: cell division protein FtsA [Christensenellales bacterium]|uniref:Cell division protein FtsA n=1 Tax=Candidatus Avichristensenella intestinipullorum TaxID=2840693 RepID=A0A9D0YWC9_9FIRM|nr:cell division protein FtsA [Christensenellales bacterium]HIQ63284.1 cell division protein FtsA [Candidatus Avichristensenella intestinipullorum]
MKNMAAAIDFGTSKVVTLVAESGGYHRCDIIGAGQVPYDGYIDGYWNTPEKVDDAIRDSIQEAEAQSHRHIREIHVGVPGEFCRVYVTETTLQLQGVDPHVTPADVERIFAMADQEIQPVRGVIIHRSPAWFMVDDGKKTMEPVGIKGSALKTFVSFIVADEFFLNDINRRMQKLGIEVAGFFSSPMGEALLFLPPEDRDRTAVLIDIGYLNTEIMAVEGDALVFHKVIPMGGAHITVDLTYGLEVTMAMAEQIKRSYIFGMPGGDNIEAVNESGRPVTFTRDDVARVLEPRVDEIAEKIREELNHSGVRLGSWSNVYLTGGGLAMMRGGREYLSAQMERPVRSPTPKAAKLNSPVYSSALGLIDLVFETIEQQVENGGVFDRLKSLFKR